MERFRRFRPLLFAIEFPWPSKYFSLKEKLKHWRSEVIARQFYWTVNLREKELFPFSFIPMN